MDSDLVEKYLPLFKQYLIPLLLGFLGLICLGYGLIVLNGQKQDSSSILADGAQTQNSLVKISDSPVKKNEITVDVEGAVLKPGVYHLASDTRIQDALIIAGGMSANADRSTVAKNLNLASKLSDGAKLYIPFTGEAVLVSSGGNVMGAQAGSGNVNINQASAIDLDNLPGIGAATAAKIISNRPYGSIDELVQKKVIGQKAFEKIKGMITAN